MKVALIGYGYWGKILYKNLISLGHDVTICESRTSGDTDFINDYKKISNVGAVFVVVPCDSHYEICKYFLERGVDVFCEKPLTVKSKETIDLYDIAVKNNSRLFVDWIFIYNQQVNKVREIVQSGELGNLKSVFMRRLNKGPVRNDVNALYDLSSHDISILFHLLGLNRKVYTLLSKSYKTNSLSSQDDSYLGVYSFGDTICTVHSSWEYPIKDRTCLFEFERGVVLWDDITQTLSLNGASIFFAEKELPLINSITTFLNKRDSNHELYQQSLTTKVMEILDHEIQ